MLKQLFRFDADSIYECEDGVTAYESYERYRPDWVFMDIKMKQLDGIAATQKITTVYPDAKIIIVTQFDDEFLRSEAKSVGAYAYVIKENIYELPNIIRAYF